jgi:hypothetical protein
VKKGGVMSAINTSYRDVKGNPLYEGQAVEYWDDESGSGVGIIIKRKSEWRIENPVEERDFGKGTIITKLEYFKNSVRYLGGKP